MEKNPITLIIAASLLLVSTSGYAADEYEFNTSEYRTIRELKAWDTHIDVYFKTENNLPEEHQCSGEYKTRFVLNPQEMQKYSLLMAAFLAGKPVLLAYKCNQDNYPQIVGVRVRK